MTKAMYSWTSAKWYVLAYFILRRLSFFIILLFFKFTFFVLFFSKSLWACSLREAL